MYALHSNGTLDWSYPAPASYVAIGTDGTIYAFSGALDALSPTGSLEWRCAGDYWGGLDWYGPGGGLALGPDGTVYVGLPGGVAACNPTGALKWETYNNGHLTTTPTTGGDGTIYYTDGALFVLNPDGSTRQSIITPDWLLPVQPVIGANGWVYVPAVRTSALYAFGPP